VTEFIQLLAKRFGFNVADPNDRKFVAFARWLWLRKFANQALPLPLRHFVLAHPESFGQANFDLRFVGTMLRLTRRTAHHKAPRRAPAKFDAAHFALIAYFCILERRANAPLTASEGHRIVGQGNTASANYE
jgi:hypothetical protein